MGIINRVEEILLLLASESDVQIKSFPDYVAVADEIAMETGDILDLILDSNEVDSICLEFLKGINSRFENVTDEFWTVEAMQSHEIWKEIRILAQEELKRQNINYRHPNLYWLTFVKVD